MSNVSSSGDDSQEELDFTKDREIDPSATYDRGKPLAEKTLDEVLEDGASSVKGAVRVDQRGGEIVYHPS